jgi:hypothetical protein
MRSRFFWGCFLAFCLLPVWAASGGDNSGSIIDLGLSARHYREDQIPQGWRLRRSLFGARSGEARWVMNNGVAAIKLHSRASLVFLQKNVNIDIFAFPVVTWKWKVGNILHGIDERKVAGDDHPIRIFFVFAPDPAKQSLWFRLKRFLYLDRIHGHPVGGRFMEYLWSSYLPPGSVIQDPGNPQQKLMVIEGGSEKLGKWLTYKKNLFEDFKDLYGEEPRELIFIGILNDTDQTGQEAVSYLADLTFHRKGFLN